MGDLTVVWQGLTLGSSGSSMGPYYLSTVNGWDDLPDITDMSSPRVRGHGDHIGGLYGRSRIVTAEGTIADGPNRNTLIDSLNDVTRLQSGLSDLSVTSFGQALSSPARVIRRSLPIKAGYGGGLVPFTIQWRCPDPLRYGTSTSPSTGLPTGGGGLTYGLTYGLDYGAAGTPGQIVLDNTGGTADASVIFSVTGSLPSGFEISAAGQRLRYVAAVPSGQTVTLNTGTGEVLVEGTADRRANLTVADWIQVPAGSALTVQFTSLGGTYDPAAVLTATAFRSAYW